VAHEEGLWGKRGAEVPVTARQCASITRYYLKGIGNNIGK